MDIENTDNRSCIYSFCSCVVFIIITLHLCQSESPRKSDGREILSEASNYQIKSNDKSVVVF